MSRLRLLIVRHAIAEDRERFAARGPSDRLRPLTERGRRRMQRGVAGLATLLPALDLVAVSPLVRARQTAELLLEAYPECEVAETETLAPEATPEAFAAWLAEHGVGRGTVAAVGHNPHLEELVDWLLGTVGAVRLKKGAVCLLTVVLPPRPGAAELLWTRPPRELRRLGEKASFEG